MPAFSYDVTLLRNDSDWLVNSSPTKTLAVRNGAVLTVIVWSNETNVGSLTAFPVYISRNITCVNCYLAFQALCSDCNYVITVVIKVRSRNTTTNSSMVVQQEALSDDVSQ